MLVISLAAGHMSGLGFATSAAADTFDIGWLASSNGGAGHSEGECYVLTATQGQNDVGPIAAMPPFMVVSVFSSVLVSLGRSEPVSLIQSLSLIGIVTLAAGFGVTLKLTKVTREENSKIKKSAVGIASSLGVGSRGPAITLARTALRNVALGLGLAACQRGLSVGCTTAAALVHELIEARDEKRLLNLQKKLARLKLLIIDELGFVPLSKTGADLLFEVFSQRYERGSVLVTTKLPFDE